MLIELPDTNLGRNIVYLRKRFYISRRGLSLLTKISEYTLRDWEQERYRPIINFEQLKRISIIFDIPSEVLVHGDASTYSAENRKVW